MSKKVETPIYDGIKAMLMFAITASKVVSGPAAWAIKLFLPKFLDSKVRPIFIKMRKKLEDRAKKADEAIVKKLTKKK